LSSVFINFQVNTKSCDGCEFEFKYYKERTKDEITNLVYAEKGEYRSPKSEFNKKFIYTVLLEKLSPDTTYRFTLTTKNWPVYNYTYTTPNLADFKIVDGGDVGNSPLTKQMVENVVSKENADLIMIGGDIAYDQNSPNCFRAWDYLMNTLPINVANADGSIRIIPLLLAVGNHDLGETTYILDSIKVTEHEPVFMHYYPQNTNHLVGIPKMKDRKTYFVQDFGDMVILSLDIGYGSRIEGEQTKFISTWLNNPNTKVKIAQYHGPIYTACEQYSQRDYVAIEYGLKHWVPVFDSHNMTIVFENHTHVFKRSKLIKNGMVDPEGTLYLGEGAWGTYHTDDQCVKTNVELHEKILGSTNVWILDINVNKGITARAYDHTGKELDKTYLEL
jgi:hypothetical protein